MKKDISVLEIDIDFKKFSARKSDIPIIDKKINNKINK
jgi:hypothetical protein